jgi:transposase
LKPPGFANAAIRHRRRIRKGNRWLKATLSQTAWAGAAKKNSTFRFRYQRLKTRRGGKRAAIAVAHAQIIALYSVLRNGVPYQQQIRELQQQQQ